MFSLKFGTAILSVYQDFSSSESGKMADKSNIQLLFDVLFIHRLLESAYNVSDGTMISEKLELKKAANSVLSAFRSRVRLLSLSS